MLFIKDIETRVKDILFDAYPSCIIYSRTAKQSDNKACFVVTVSNTTSSLNAGLQRKAVEIIIQYFDGLDRNLSEDFTAVQDKLISELFVDSMVVKNRAIHIDNATNQIIDNVLSVRFSGYYHDIIVSNHKPKDLMAKLNSNMNIQKQD